MDRGSVDLSLDLTISKIESNFWIFDDCDTSTSCGVVDEELRRVSIWSIRLFILSFFLIMRI